MHLQIWRPSWYWALQNSAGWECLWACRGEVAFQLVSSCDSNVHWSKCSGINLSGWPNQSYERASVCLRIHITWQSASGHAQPHHPAICGALQLGRHNAFASIQATLVSRRTIYGVLPLNSWTGIGHCVPGGNCSNIHEQPLYHWSKFPCQSTLWDFICCAIQGWLSGALPCPTLVVGVDPDLVTTSSNTLRQALFHNLEGPLAHLQLYS